MFEALSCRDGKEYEGILQVKKIVSGCPIKDGKLQGLQKNYVILCNFCGKPLIIYRWCNHFLSPTEVYVDPCDCQRKRIEESKTEVL